MSRLSKEEYMRTQMQIISIGRAASNLDIEAFINQMSEAEAVAPMIDPTLYRKAIENMRAIKDLARAILPVKDAFEKTFHAVVKTAMAAQTENTDSDTNQPI